MPMAAIFYENLVRGAVASLVLLAVASAAVLVIRQPARRIRVIQWTLAGLVALPCLMLLPGYPRVAVLPHVGGRSPVHSSDDVQGAIEAARPDEPAEAAHVPRAPLAAPPVESAARATIVQQPEQPGPALPQPQSAAAIEEPLAAPAIVVPLMPREVGNESNAPPVEDSEGPVESAAPPASWRLPQDFRVWALAAYATGVIGMALWSLLGLLAVKRLLGGSRAAPPECRIILRAVGGPRTERVDLRVSARAAQPCAVRWRRTTIVLPERLVAEIDSQALRWALAHEWSHVERGDLVTWTASGLVRWFYFYQPLLWWLRGQLQLCQDYIADAAAARTGELPEDYAEFLTTSSFTRPTLATGLGIGGRISDLRRRVVMLVERRRVLESKSPRRWNLLALPVAALVVAVTAGLAQKEDSPKPAAPPSEAAQAATPATASAGVEDGPKPASPRPSIAASAPSSTRKIKPGDELALDVIDNLDSLKLDGLRLLLRPGTTVMVDNDGEISLGSQYRSIDVGGRTLRDAEILIADLLRVRIVNNHNDLEKDLLRRVQINVRLNIVDGAKRATAASATFEKATPAAAGPVIAPTYESAAEVDAFKTKTAPRLIPGDTLDIEAVFENGERLVLGDVPVDNAGLISLGAKYGRLKVSGQWPHDAERALTQWLTNEGGSPAKVQISHYPKPTPMPPMLAPGVVTAPAATPRPAGPTVSPFLNLAQGAAAVMPHEHIQPGDVLHIEAEPLAAEMNLDSTVEADGNVALGVRWGRVNVANKTLAEAEELIKSRVGETIAGPMVQVKYVQQLVGVRVNTSTQADETTRLRELEHEIAQLKATIRRLEHALKEQQKPNARPDVKPELE